MKSTIHKPEKKLIHNQGEGTPAAKAVEKIFQICFKINSPKNENSVINYSPSCRSKP